jgi:hypothetical protein
MSRDKGAQEVDNWLWWKFVTLFKSLWRHGYDQYYKKARPDGDYISEVKVGPFRMIHYVCDCHPDQMLNIKLFKFNLVGNFDGKDTATWRLI